LIFDASYKFQKPKDDLDVSSNETKDEIEENVISPEEKVKSWVQLIDEEEAKDSKKVAHIFGFSV